MYIIYKIYNNICIELNFAFVSFILLVVLNEILHNYTFYFINIIK